MLLLFFIHGHFMFAMIWPHSHSLRFFRQTLQRNFVIDRRQLLFSKGFEEFSTSFFIIFENSRKRQKKSPWPVIFIYLILFFLFFIYFSTIALTSASFKPMYVILGRILLRFEYINQYAPLSETSILTYSDWQMTNK